MGVCVLALGAKMKILCETQGDGLEPPGGQKNHFLYIFISGT